MGKQIDDLVLLAILQNQIKNAVSENKIDVSKFASCKKISNASALTEDEKNDIGENAYNFLCDLSDKSIYTLAYNYSVNSWLYIQVTYKNIFSLTRNSLGRHEFKMNYAVRCNINGDVTSSRVVNVDGSFARPDSVTLVSDKYPYVTFYANYFNTDNNDMYRFSSGIILDSSEETSQYKIVFASYNISTAKVTFVEKVLT